MKKQSSFLKSFVLILGMLAMLLASWEQSKADGVLAQAGADVIPQESIRLRILADSDNVADQMLKRRIRDAVIASMNEWVTELESLDQARAVVRAKLPELEQLAAEMAADAGFQYDVKVELGMVPFPTKVYGGKLYPAGEYEALRITLGRGLGQNWWCVLFPPLCFVDIAAAETPEGEGEAGISTAVLDSDEVKVEYRFFLVDVVANLIGAVKNWLA